MATRIYTPERSRVDKDTTGRSDAYGNGSVLKFMGASVLSSNMTLGFNGTASSLSLTLVEDTVNGDAFLFPEIPSLWAFSLPRGGVGAPTLYNPGVSLQPASFEGSNVPFYFCGICTNY